MRETEEWLADSEDDLFDGDESADYDEDDECFDENVDKDVEWAGILQDAFEDEMRFDSDDHTDGDSPDEFNNQKNSDEDDVGEYNHVHNCGASFNCGYKKALWKAAKTTIVSQFQRAMQDIADLDVRFLEWLQDKPTSQRSKSHFSTYPKCDFLLNNLCESFNNCILEAREKPILTMLEWIREYVMTRMQQLRDRAERLWEGRKLCPKIKKIVDNNLK
ncbi:UNVERIFIED_CONTAM: hypothetical protein Sindi_0994700 [Sesamum indicum]